MGSEVRAGGTADLPFNTVVGNKLQEFKVTGDWSQDKAAFAAQLLYKVANYGSAQTGRYLSSATRDATTRNKVTAANGQTYFDAVRTGAEALRITNNSNVLNWLNAFNAPHWTLLNGVNGWASSQTNSPPATSIEKYGASWMRDLMVAKGLTNIAGLTQGNSSFRGATDANHGYTPFGHASHDLGMAMDLGTLQHVGEQGYFGDTASTAITQIVAPATPGIWSNNLAAQYVQQMICSPGRRHDLAFSDFALLYASFVSGANGSRDALSNQIIGSTNTAAVLDAMFGDGTQTGSIVNGVIIGGNVRTKSDTGNETYPDIRYALSRLGFLGSNPTVGGRLSVSKGGPHYNHFHIYLQPPARRDLPNLLLASSMGNTVQDYQERIADSNSSKPITPGMVRRIEKLNLKNCREVENQSSPEKSGVRAGELQFPASYVLRALTTDYGIQPQSTVATKITKQPLNGKLTPDFWSDPNVRGEPKHSFQYYKYVPNTEFYGKDRYEFEVTVNGKVFRGSVTLNVVKSWDNGERCKPPGEDRGTLDAEIKYAWDLESLEEIIPLNAGDLAAWQRNAKLSALIASAQQTLTGFTDLPATALGQTTGEGTTAQITLDQNAAGHGWYIDPTPLDNTDGYLPTSNPEV